jgi:MFS family permease
MKSDVSIKRLNDFPRLLWILLFGAFITRGSFYMVWPFLSVILYQKFALSATEVGLILSVAALVSVFIGFIGGTLSDRFGRHQLMYGSGILYVVSFSLLAQAQALTTYIVVITLCSIAKAMWEPPTSALIGDIVPDSKTRELAMQVRYFLINVGAALGPMLGVWYGFTGQQSSFYITAGAFALLLLLLTWGFNSHGRIQTGADSRSNNGEKFSSHGFKQTLMILKQDKVLQCLILANMLCLYIYAQMDTSLIQYLTRAEVPELITLISSIILTNSVVIICCQFLLLKIMAGLALISRIQIALVFLTLSQLWLALNPINFYWGWIGAIALMSLAEAVLFPSMNVHIDRIAPPHLRGAYFGAASFYSLGFALAPLGGGMLLDSFGGPWIFFMGAGLCLVVIYLYRVIDKMSPPVSTQRI